MLSKPHREVVGRLRGSRRLAALAATLIATLAAMPTASALAGASASPDASASGSSAPAVQPFAVPGEMLSAQELQKLLSGLSLNDLSSAQLAHYLAGLEGVSGLAGLEKGLLGGKLGLSSLEQALREAIEQLKLSKSPTLGELGNLNDLLPALEGKLGGLLETLLGSSLGTGQREALEHALGSLALDQLVGSLLGSAKSEEPVLKEALLTQLSSLADALFAQLGTEGKLEGLLGSTLTKGFAPKSVKEVAEELKTTPAAVSKELGQTAAQLPETATMLTAPLADGKARGARPRGQRARPRHQGARPRPPRRG